MSPARRCLGPYLVLAAAGMLAFDHGGAWADDAAGPTSFAALCERVFAAIDDAEIRFGLQGSEIRPSSHAALDRIINFARNCDDRSILIVGHSDAIGDESFNLHISRQRAQAVADYLRAGGIASSRLRIEGLGSAAPVADNETRSGRAQNRRVELKLLPEAVSGE